MIPHNESARPVIFLNSQLQDNGREVEKDQIVARHSCRVFKVTLCILMVIFFIILIIVDPFSHCITNDAEHATSNQTPERHYDDKPHNPCTGKVGGALTYCELKRYNNTCKPCLRRIELKNLFSDRNASPPYVFLDRCDSACTWCGSGNQTCAPVNWDGRFAVRNFTITIDEQYSTEATIRIPVHSHCDCQNRHNIVAESIGLIFNKFNGTISSLNEKFNISKAVDG